MWLRETENSVELLASGSIPKLFQKNNKHIYAKVIELGFYWYGVHIIPTKEPKCHFLEEPIK